MRYLNTWIWFNTILWVVSFMVMLFGLNMLFSDQDPFSPGFNGLTSEGVGRIERALYQIYLPYLGLISTAAITFQARLKKIKPGSGLHWPIMVVLIGFIFNFMVGYKIYSYYLTVTQDYHVLLDRLNDTTLFFGLFVSITLGFFYNFGWNNPEGSKDLKLEQNT